MLDIHPTAHHGPLSNIQIIIKRQERTKRKKETHIQGLELFGIDLKKAAKQFASKFATGSSVSKNPQGEDEIVIQGDVGDEIVSARTAAVVCGTDSVLKRNKDRRGRECVPGYVVSSR